jgi:hypothetical protein
MKKILILLLSTVSLLADPLRTNVTLFWDYDPALLTNITFIVRGTNQLVAPYAAWPVVSIVPAQPNRATPTNLTVHLQPQAFFFICQSSNLWGVSDPSNVASTPAPPRSDYSLGVR